ncbi:MAG: putative sulfate exporter family transporter [Paucibacter sp.]|nr:putative sulfate exporter family transporter [Roseateles sp.]
MWCARASDAQQNPVFHGRGRQAGESQPVGCGRLGAPPKSIAATVTDVDTLLLTMAMGARGLTTHIASIRKAGAKRLLPAAINNIVIGLVHCTLCPQRSPRREDRWGQPKILIRSRGRGPASHA